MSQEVKVDKFLFHLLRIGIWDYTSATAIPVFDQRLNSAIRITRAANGPDIGC